MVGELDLNGDGVISYDEFKAMMQGLNTHSARLISFLLVVVCSYGFRYQALLDSEVHPDSDASLAKMTGE